MIVDNAAGNSVQLWPADLPDDGAQRAAVLRRLSQVLDVPVRWLERQIAKRGSDPLTPIVVKRGVHDDHVFYIAERPEQFPGVQVATSFLRRYPYKALGAQMLGHVGEVSPDQLEASDDPGLAPGDEVGQAGVESVYDEFLRGRTGSQRLRVDSLGRPLGERTLAQEAQPGYALRLTVDVAPPAGGRARAAVRDPAGACDGRVVRERRRDRRAWTRATARSSRSPRTRPSSRTSSSAASSSASSRRPG